MKWTSHIAQLTRHTEPLEGGRDRAGVLVAIGRGEDGRESLVLTKRTQYVKTHKGQVSFPGGLWEPGDQCLRDTALREAEEEIGLQPHHVEVIGPLPPVETRATLPIQPWVGYFSLPYSYVMSDAEVDRIILLPLERLMKEGLEEVRVSVGLFRMRGPGIEVDGELVWGATARILQALLPKP